jgi:cell division protein FtsZ
VIHSVAHPDANIIFGAVIDDEMGDEVRVTVIAAGFDRWDDKKGAPPATAEPRSNRAADLFGPDDDEGDLGDDDEFDVPSFLK